jgi:cyclic pyranopterin phosphate synthase
MVDVSQKPNTPRTAVAEGTVYLKEETLRLITAGLVPKGDVFAAARIAGIMAAKNTPALIPLCHPLPLDAVEVTLEPKGVTQICITAKAATTWHTGVEMEALAAVSAACLCVYDMCKAVERGMTIGEIRLLEKTGGVKGVWHAAGQKESPYGTPPVYPTANN